MNASLDTNIIIHLYKAGFQNILFNRFNKVIVYEFVRKHELVNHATNAVISQFNQDVSKQKIEIVTDTYLKNIGMYNLFMYHVDQQRLVYEGADLGEVYAIALANTFGYISLVTDDIKMYGPHFTLMRTPDSDVIPFAFYEILFLDYLESKINEISRVEYFNIICEHSDLKMNLSSKLKQFIKRFWSDPYTISEKEWMQDFCNERNINSRLRMKRLSLHLKKKKQPVVYHS